MSGHTYSELKPGDLCWVIVSDDFPTGYWRGEVVGFKEEELKSYFGCEPDKSYHVIPSNKVFDGLIHLIVSLEEDLMRQRATAKAKIDILKEAIAYATHRSGDDLLALLDKKR